jgi:hypothetical protein
MLRIVIEERSDGNHMEKKNNTATILCYACRCQKMGLVGVCFLVKEPLSHDCQRKPSQGGSVRDERQMGKTIINYTF